MRKGITLNESFPSIADSIKRLSKGVMDSSQLSDIRFGVVENVRPLRIRVDQKILLTDEYLILTNAVKDHAVDISVSWETEKDDYLDENAMMHTHDGSPLVGNLGNPIAGQTGITMNFDTTHHHDIKGRKKIIIHNGLTVGEKVLLLRTQGGQNYVVIDRVDEIPTSGEWI